MRSTGGTEGGINPRHGKAELQVAGSCNLGGRQRGSRKQQSPSPSGSTTWPARLPCLLQRAEGVHIFGGPGSAPSKHIILGNCTEGRNKQLLFILKTMKDSVPTATCSSLSTGCSLGMATKPAKDTHQNKPT